MKEQAFFVCSFIVLHILQVKLILFRMSEKMSLLRDLQIDFNVKNARELSTYKGGGDAIVVRPESVEKLCETVEVFKREKIEFAMLAKGSNTLIPDGLCDRIFIDTRSLDKVEIKKDRAYALSGASVRKVMMEGRSKGLCGLEFLSGVPCSVGGAIKMNASAFLTQTKDYIDEIYILNADIANFGKMNNRKTMSKRQDFISETNDDFFEETGIGSLVEKGVVCVKKSDEIGWGYRCGEGGIILGAKMKLKCCIIGESERAAKVYFEKRRAKQPALPSLGSTFKNGQIPSGKLIEDCRLKGVKAGGAQISEMHANFIVNTGSGNASDYLKLANECKRRVFETFGITLEEEFVTY